MKIMWAILKHEINTFFGSAVGFLIVAVFVLFNGLILFVFRGDFNIFDYGFADLSPFFLWLPWIFLLLIPAVTMRSFSEEFKSGTIELLKIKPISNRELVLGKFLGSWAVILLALFPSLLYIWCLNSLTVSGQEIDSGIIGSSYLGLILVSAAYTAIGIWTSSTTQNQIVAFVLALGISWSLYVGFEGLGTLFTGKYSVYVADWGIKAHFEDFIRGVVPLSDLVYFLTLTALFITATILGIRKKL